MGPTLSTFDEIGTLEHSELIEEGLPPTGEKDSENSYKKKAPTTCEQMMGATSIYSFTVFRK